MFVNILREAIRESSGPDGSGDLLRSLDMLGRGAKVTAGDLVNAALDRIRPPRDFHIEGWGYDERSDLLFAVACAGLGLLIENAARDGAAKSRASRRRHELVMAIRAYEKFTDKQRQARVRVDIKPLPRGRPPQKPK
jgi:hypothetical protein